MISELYDAEIFLNQILNTKNIQTKNFVLLDKEWLNKWKILVDYDQIKNKCKNTENINTLKDEISKLFIRLKTKQRLEELGKIDCSKFKRNNNSENSRQIHLDELGNYMLILDFGCIYFSSYIQGRITVRADILDGRIYIYDFISKKDKYKKLILLYNYNENNDFKKYAIILEKNANIQNVIKELKNKKIDELLINKELAKEIFNKVNIKAIEDEKEIERKQKEEEERKRKKEEGKRKEEEEEEEKGTKEEEQKRQEKERKIKEEEKKKRNEEEQKRIEKKRKKKEEEERKLKEEEKKKLEKERKRKEEEERKIKEEERKRLEEERRRKEEEERKRKIEEEEKRKK